MPSEPSDVERRQPGGRVAGRRLTLARRLAADERHDGLRRHRRQGQSQMEKPSLAKPKAEKDPQPELPF